MLYSVDPAIRKKPSNSYNLSIGSYLNTLGWVWYIQKFKKQNTEQMILTYFQKCLRTYSRYTSFGVDDIYIVEGNMSRKANKKVTWILWGLKISKEEYSWLLYALHIYIIR